MKKKYLIYPYVMNSIFGYCSEVILLTEFTRVRIKKQYLTPSLKLESIEEASTRQLKFLKKGFLDSVSVSHD